jgi:hypothetical protein
MSSFNASLGIVAAQRPANLRLPPAPRPRQQALPSNSIAPGADVRVSVGGAASSKVHLAFSRLGPLCSKRGRLRLLIPCAVVILGCLAGLPSCVSLISASGPPDSSPFHLGSLVLAGLREVREV